MTEDQAAKLQLLLFEAGMPPKLKRVVSRYCEDDTEESEVWFRYTSQLVDVHNLQITFPDLLSDPRLASAEKKIASALDDFSRSTYIRVR